MKRVHGLGAAIALILLCSYGKAQAEIYCVETLTRVIVASNGSVYFTTAQTCPNWCQINWSDAGAVSKAYATLLSAEAQATPVTLGWSGISSCSDENATYASPDNLTLPAP